MKEMSQRGIEGYLKNQSKVVEVKVTNTPKEKDNSWRIRSVGVRFDTDMTGDYNRSRERDKHNIT